MSKRNYQFEKRQKDLAKKEKREEKLQRKRSRSESQAEKDSTLPPPEELRRHGGAVHTEENRDYPG